LQLIYFCHKSLRERENSVTMSFTRHEVEDGRCRTKLLRLVLGSSANDFPPRYLPWKNTAVLGSIKKVIFIRHVKRTSTMCKVTVKRLLTNVKKSNVQIQ